MPRTISRKTPKHLEGHIYLLEYKLAVERRLRRVAEAVLKELATNEKNRDLTNVYWIEHQRLLSRKRSKVGKKRTRSRT